MIDYTIRTVGGVAFSLSGLGVCVKIGYEKKKIPHISMAKLNRDPDEAG